MLMEQMNIADQSENVTRRRAGVKRMIKHHLKVDMTPMVDLGFLLISFFVITTELSKPTVMDIVMPSEGKPIDLANSGALTVIAKNDIIYYYEGNWDEAYKNNRIYKTALTGKMSFRQVIQNKKLKLGANKSFKEGSDGLMMLVKPGKGTSYKVLVDIIDEATINMVKKYAVIKQTPEEENWLEKVQ